MTGLKRNIFFATLLLCSFLINVSPHHLGFLHEDEEGGNNLDDDVDIELEVPDEEADVSEGDIAGGIDKDDSLGVEIGEDKAEEVEVDESNEEGDELDEEKTDDEIAEEEVEDEIAKEEDEVIEEDPEEEAVEEEAKVEEEIAADADKDEEDSAIEEAAAEEELAVGDESGGRRFPLSWYDRVKNYFKSLYGGN